MIHITPDQAKFDNKMMKLAKVSHVSHVIAHTDKGDLTMDLVTGGTEFDYKFLLDSVPFDEATNKSLLRIFSTK